ncbi:MAG TPA: hypothetical protein VM324_15840 [Egibacteraceae bacterium]|nr:hypothetical protein [Egibacteraceae bacterium]
MAQDPEPPPLRLPATPHDPVPRYAPAPPADDDASTEEDADALR